MKKEAIDKSSLAHKMELQVSHCICAKVQKKGILRGKAIRDTRNIATIMPMERGRNYRGRGMCRPYPYAGEYPAQNERFGIYGISKRKKRVIDISKVGKHEVCIPKSRVLV